MYGAEGIRQVISISSILLTTLNCSKKLKSIKKNDWHICGSVSNTGQKFGVKETSQKGCHSRSAVTEETFWKWFLG